MILTEQGKPINFKLMIKRKNIYIFWIKIILMMQKTFFYNNLGYGGH